MLRLAVCLMALLPLSASFGQQKSAKPGDETPVSVGTVGGIDVKVQPFVSNGIPLSNFKYEKGEISFVAEYKRGPKNNIRYDFYDADDVRIFGGFVNPDDLILDEKSKITISVKNPDKVKTLKIVRSIKIP